MTDSDRSLDSVPARPPPLPLLLPFRLRYGHPPSLSAVSVALRKSPAVIWIRISVPIWLLNIFRYQCFHLFCPTCALFRVAI
jgi:hypothetical protein